MKFPIFDPTPLQSGADVRTIQQNFEALVEWMRSLQKELDVAIGQTLVLGSHFQSMDAAPRRVPGLSFQPEASKTYLVRGLLLLRTEASVIGARPGLEFPAGVVDGAFRVTAPNSAIAEAMLNGTIAGGVAASTGLPTANATYLAILDGVVGAGGAPSGEVSVTLATETAGTIVSMRKGSALTYRAI